MPIKYELFFNNTFWSINAGQSGSESNSNERVPYIPLIFRKEPHQQMQFSVIPRTHFITYVRNSDIWDDKNDATLWAASVSLCVGACQRILLFVLARNPHKGPAHAISHETRSGRVKECPKKDRRGQSAGESSQEKFSQKMKAGQKREKTRSQKEDC